MKILCVKVFCLICCLIMLFGCSNKGANRKKDDKQIRSFSLSDYSEKLEEFPQNIQVGPITNYQEAVQCAKSVWKEVYNKEIDYVGYRVCYDDATQSWLIYALLEKDTDGGGPCVIIDGKENVAVAVWRSK